jgi:hypothetical protein
MKTLSIVLFILLAACSERRSDRKNDEPEIEGGQCIYDDFQKVGYISEIVMDDRDSIAEIQFTFDGESPTGLLKLRGEKLKKFVEQIAYKKTLQDSSQEYLLHGDYIVKGSCYPYFINKINVVKK